MINVHQSYHIFAFTDTTSTSTFRSNIIKRDASVISVFLNARFEQLRMRSAEDEGRADDMRVEVSWLALFRQYGVRRAWIWNGKKKRSANEPCLDSARSGW